MPSRAYTSFLPAAKSVKASTPVMCQCPLGLIHHFYTNAVVLFVIVVASVNALSGLYIISTAKQIETICLEEVECQCPLGLIHHFYLYRKRLGGNLESCVNALSGLYIISTVPLQKPRFYAVSRACFCRYLSEYSDNSRFSCMLTFWTYLMRCTYP